MKRVIEITIQSFLEPLTTVFAIEVKVFVVTRLKQRPATAGVYPARVRHNRVHDMNLIAGIEEAPSKMPTDKTSPTRYQYLSHK